MLLLGNHPPQLRFSAAKDNKLNPNQWEVHLIELNFCEDTRPDPQLQKAKEQHSMLINKLYNIANLNRQKYREVKLHVILVGAMGPSTKTTQTNL